MSMFESAVAQANAMQAQGATAAQINAMLATYGYGGQVAVTPAVVSSALESWVGSPAAPTAQAQAIALPALAGGLLAVLRWILTQFGAKQILVGLFSLIGIQLFKEVIDESGQGRVESIIATLIPGQQEFLGEWPAGLGQIEGRLVQKWTAGGAKVYFASFEQPTRQGSHIQYYVYSVKRQAWLPYSYRRNIVFGARELDIAAALGGRKRIGKKKALRALAGKYGGTRSKKE